MDIIKIKRPGIKTIQKAVESPDMVLTNGKDGFCDSILLKYMKNKIMRKFASNPDCTLYLSKEKDKVTGLAFLSLLDWDTKIFGFKIGRIEYLFMRMDHKARFRFLNNIIKDCKTENYRHINYRIGLNDVGNIAVFERSGFSVADIQLTLSTPIRFGSANSVIPSNIIIRKASTKDLPWLETMVKGIFTNTRFVIDKKYPKEKVDKLYFEWVKNSISDKDQSVFVVQKKDLVIGFSICSIDPDSKKALGLKIGAIDLIAVSKEYRNKGIGKALVEFALKWMRRRVDKVEIRTQVSNIPAIKAFMKGGFSEISCGVMLPSGISLHWWFKKRGQYENLDIGC